MSIWVPSDVNGTGQRTLSRSFETLKRCFISRKNEASVLKTRGISQATFDRWQTQYRGMQAEEAKRLEEVEDEKRPLN